MFVNKNRCISVTQVSEEDKSIDLLCERWFPFQASTSVLCLHYRPARDSTLQYYNAYTSEITLSLHHNSLTLVNKHRSPEPHEYNFGSNGYTFGPDVITAISQQENSDLYHTLNQSFTCPAIIAYICCIKRAKFTRLASSTSKSVSGIRLH